MGNSPAGTEVLISIDFGKTPWRISHEVDHQIALVEWDQHPACAFDHPAPSDGRFGQEGLKLSKIDPGSGTVDIGVSEPVR